MGGKATYTCPVCNRIVKDLKAHTKRMHPGGDPPLEKVKGKKLEFEVPKEKEKKEKSQGYHCIDCGAGVSKGQTPCPSCGTQLDWSQV